MLLILAVAAKNFVFWLCYVHFSFLFTLLSNFSTITCWLRKKKNVESCLSCFTLCFYCYLLLPIIPLFMPSLIKLVWLFSFFPPTGFKRYAHFWYKLLPPYSTLTSINNNNIWIEVDLLNYNFRNCCKLFINSEMKYFIFTPFHVAFYPNILAT